MAFILSSFLKTHLRDEAGNRIPVALDNENGILDSITAHLPHTEKLVVVANDPNDCADNTEKLETVRKSFEMTGISFSQAVVLDGRNSCAAESIICDADLIILSGGKCLCQNRFFQEIGLKHLLAKSAALTVGISAGAMNLCKTVANFPEEESDLPEPRWFDGLGFFDGIVVPHFDGETKKYQLDCGDVDTAHKYILPMSRGREFIGLPNGSYILVRENGSIEYFGDVYRIADGTVIKL